MKRLIILLAVISTLNATAQQAFQRLIGGSEADRSQTIFSTFDNGYIVNGASLSTGAGDADAILIKTDDQGQVIWSNAYGMINYDNSEYAIETFDHNIVCAGRSNFSSGGPTSAIIFKVDSIGGLLWTKAFGNVGNDGLVQIIETSDHGYAAVGNTVTLGTGGSSDILLIRTNSNGDTLFTHSYGTNELEAGLSLVQLPDDGFIICGRQSMFSGGQLRADGLLLRTDANGTLLWSKQYGDSLWEEFNAVQLLPDSGFILTGSTVTFGAGSFDILLMKTDSGGNVTWSETFGDAETDAAYDVHVTSDNSFVLSGYTESLGYGHRGGDSANVFLLKTDSNGALQWMEVYGDGLQDEAFRSNKASDGGYVVSGFTKNYILGDSAQMIFIKTDSAGLSGCHEESVQPLDTFFIMPQQNILLTEKSGMASTSLGYLPTSFVFNNDDACMFTSINRQRFQGEKIYVSPNPFHDQLAVKIPDDNFSSGKIELYDIYGRVVKMEVATNSSPTIETSDLKPGVYFISFSSPLKTINSTIIVKE